MKTEDLIERLLLLVPARGVGRAIKFARERHSGQVRRGGEPYVNHVIRVGIACGEYARVRLPDALETLVVSGLLHDVLEDTETTIEEFQKIFGHEIAEIVRAVSHEHEDEPDEVYLERVVAGGELAILVKRFDRLDNIQSLKTADAEFRSRKLAQTWAMLPLVSSFDPEGAEAMRQALIAIKEGDS